MQGMAYAHNTQRTYGCHERSFRDFCDKFGYRVVPTENSTLCRYATYLSYRLSYSSITQYLNIIRILNVSAGYANPLDDNYDLRCVLRGIRRSIGDSVTRKTPITPALLLDILSTLNLESTLDSAFWAAALVSFYGMLRRSNVSVPSANNFDTTRTLLRSDFKFSDEGILLTVRWTKTIQFKERVLKIPLPRTNNALCPFLAVTKHFNGTVGAKPGEPAFLSARNMPLTTSTFIKKLKSCLTQKGHDANDFSGHSFRRGGASFAHQCGVPLRTIQQIGDWKSESYSAYVFDSVPSLRDHNLLIAAKIKAILNSSVI